MNNKIYFIYMSLKFEIRNHLNSVDADSNRIYNELTFDCTDEIMRDVKSAVEKAALNNVIDDELAELLIVDDSKPGNIYFLPKTLPHHRVHQSVIQSMHLP